MDTTIVADVQAPVIEAFGQDQKLGWIGVGFPLGSVSVILSVFVTALTWQTSISLTYFA